MIRLSPSAAAGILQILQDECAGDHAGMRLKMVPPDEFYLQLDSACETDIVMTHEGKTTLIVDRRLADRLRDAIVDLEDSGAGTAFTVRRIGDNGHRALLRSSV